MCLWCPVNQVMECIWNLMYQYISWVYIIFSIDFPCRFMCCPWNFGHAINQIASYGYMYGSGYGGAAVLLPVFSYQLTAKPGNKTAALPWPNPYIMCYIGSWHINNVWFYPWFRVSCVPNDVAAYYCVEHKLYILTFPGEIHDTKYIPFWRLSVTPVC